MIDPVEIFGDASARSPVLCDEQVERLYQRADDGLDRLGRHDPIMHQLGQFSDLRTRQQDHFDHVMIQVAQNLSRNIKFAGTGGHAHFHYGQDDRTRTNKTQMTVYLRPQGSRDIDTRLVYTFDLNETLTVKAQNHGDGRLLGLNLFGKIDQAICEAAPLDEDGYVSRATVALVLSDMAARLSLSQKDVLLAINPNTRFPGETQLAARADIA